VNKHSFEKAKQMDVFSWGLILLWAILVRVKLSDLSYKAQLDVLSALKSDRKLLETAKSTLDEVFSSPALEPADREVGGQLFRILERCLQHDPQLRAKTACEVLSIMPEPLDGGPVYVPAFNPQDEKDLSLPTHTSFTVQKSISQLSTVDYRVRRFILDELSHRTEYACDKCRERARYESAVALKLGFGGHSISRIHFDNFLLSATDDGTDPYCSHALQTIRDIAISSSDKLSLPTIDSDSEVHNIEDLVQADLVHEYQRRREMETAVDFYKKEIEIRQARLGEDHSLVLVLQSVLLLVYEACGNLFASQEISKGIYVSLDGRFGPDHPSTLQAMAQYALQSVNAGQPSLAISLGEEFVARGEKTFDHTDNIFITGISNLGLAYYYLELYSEAETAFETALEHHGVALDSNRLDRSKIQMNLAHAIKAQGQNRYQEAEQLLVEASSQLEKNLGYLHRDTISSLAARALSFYDGPGISNPNSDVVQFRETVVTITKEFLGSQHPDTLIVIANYASSLQNSGSWVEAKTLFEEVLEALQNVPSDTQLQYVYVMANFAVGCSENDELDKAEELILHVLSILRGGLSPLGPKSILAQHALATLMNIYCLRDDIEKAERLLMVIWESIKDGLGDALAQRHILISVRNIAVSCLDRGYRVSEAHDLLLELLETTKRCNGPNHADTIITRNEVGESFRRQRLYSKAEKIHLENLRICREEFEPHNETTLAVMSNLAMIYYWQVKGDQAADLMYQVYLAEAETLGPSHNETVSSAGWVISMRQYFDVECSLDMFPGVFDPRKRVEGTDRDSIEAKLTLASAYESLEHVDEAREIVEGAVKACKRRFGDTDLLTLRAWARLAHTLHTAFLNSASSSHLERAKDIANFVFEEYHKLHGEYHEDTAEAEILLGHILRDNGLYAEAELHYKHALLAAEMLSGENVYSVIEILEHLLKLYQKQGGEESARIISDRITNLKREMDQNETLHVSPEVQT
jgi:tetratricopeptide (TPR) repeat protein